MSITTEELLSRASIAKVVPVLTIPNIESAVPLAKALAEGGLDVLEVTLRTPCAFDAIQAIAESDVDCLIGAGTITTPANVVNTASAGAQFLVSPGTTPALSEAMLAFDGPSLPGVATPSEAMMRAEEGFDVLKFFPAEASGGTAFLKGLSGPLPHIQFMPTGGISLSNAGAYLALKSVKAVGGSWVAPADLIAAKDWAAITQLARDAKETLS